MCQWLAILVSMKREMVERPIRIGDPDFGGLPLRQWLLFPFDDQASGRLAWHDATRTQGSIAGLSEA